MTAEPTGDVVWTPNPIRQRLADHTLEDVLTLPDGAPRVELVRSAPFDIKLRIRDITP